MSLFEKISHYVMKLGEFVGDDPREANTEGGFSSHLRHRVNGDHYVHYRDTFWVIAAVYLREYATQGALTQTIRIAVTTSRVSLPLSTVSWSGLFVYWGNIDKLFYPGSALPSPTFGTGGLMWASITLAILTCRW